MEQITRTICVLWWFRFHYNFTWKRWLWDFAEKIYTAWNISRYSFYSVEIFCLNILSVANEYELPIPAAAEHQWLKHSKVGVLMRTDTDTVTQKTDYGVVFSFSFLCLLKNLCNFQWMNASQCLIKWWELIGSRIYHRWYISIFCFVCSMKKKCNRLNSHIFIINTRR